MRLGVLTACFLVLAAPAAAAGGARYWSVDRALSRIDRVPIRVGERRVRVDADTTLCAGRGPSIRRAGVRRWSRFACTYTTFVHGGIDRDLEFVLHVRSATRFAISNAHWVGG